MESEIRQTEPLPETNDLIAQGFLERSLQKAINQYPLREFHERWSAALSDWM
jgi:hypothetical protein